VETRTQRDGQGLERLHEILHIRHSSLFTPRDFDISPFFKIIKPTIELGFDYTRLEWSQPPPQRREERSVPTSLSALVLARRLVQRLVHGWRRLWQAALL
jgi:hypothetical protein